MTDVRLILHNLFRKVVRTLLLITATMIAFLIYGTLAGFDESIEQVYSKIPADRLITVNTINFTQPLPYAYVNRVRTIEGVERASHANWFGGYYREERNQVATFAVDPETYMDVAPEILVDPQVRARFVGTRGAMIAPRRLADQYGWQVGDQVSLFSNIFPRENGSYAWPFEFAGVYDIRAEYGEGGGAVLIHYDYFNEARRFGRDDVGWITIDAVSPEAADRIAEEVDALFANSRAQTETSSAAAFQRGFLEQSISIASVVTLVSTAGFATILLIVGNAMVVAIRERTREVAVLKTLGFGSGRIFRLILGESLALVLIGGALGLGLTALIFSMLSQVPGNPLPPLKLYPITIATAVGYMVLLGIVTGLIPAVGAWRLKIVTALGRE
ncbi:hypothetical protein CCR85_05505 [Rhodothalassium salexigens]|uniref:ABC transporter permease n=1 Tax=Rhodothalassium salexigens TaxID=1086 RepID=UPI0019134A06|nr:FtsX-like permease family protein [Rhodothalassium salexigens]MBK5910949.1 hypothetical protein [Rhodothalassium salexigens]MBK5921272.1 hypothetical protein [Rhodothalassium salexigens]